MKFFLLFSLSHPAYFLSLMYVHVCIVQSPLPRGDMDTQCYHGNQSQIFTWKLQQHLQTSWLVGHLREWDKFLCHFPDWSIVIDDHLSQPREVGIHWATCCLMCNIVEAYTNYNGGTIIIHVWVSNSTRVESPPFVRLGNTHIALLSMARYCRKVDSCTTQDVTVNISYLFSYLNKNVYIHITEI